MVLEPDFLPKEIIWRGGGGNLDLLPPSFAAYIIERKRLARTALSLRVSLSAYALSRLSQERDGLTPKFSDLILYRKDSNIVNTQLLDSNFYRCQEWVMKLWIQHYEWIQPKWIPTEQIPNKDFQKMDYPCMHRLIYISYSLLNYLFIIQSGDCFRLVFFE